MSRRLLPFARPKLYVLEDTSFYRICLNSVIQAVVMCTYISLFELIVVKWFQE